MGANGRWKRDLDSHLLLITLVEVRGDQKCSIACFPLLLLSSSKRYYAGVFASLLRNSRYNNALFSFVLEFEDRLGFYILKIYLLYYLEQPGLGAKISGMLLEMDSAESLLLRGSPESLSAKVEDAAQVLTNSNTKVGVLHSNFLSAGVAVN